MAALSSLAFFAVPLLPFQTEFGDPCVGSTGIEPRFELRSDVKPGLPIRADLFGAPGTTGFLIAGTSAAQWGALPLPLALGEVDPLFGSCALNVSADFLLPVSLDNSGRAKLEFQGFAESSEVFLQFWNLDLGVVPISTLGGLSPGYRVESEPVDSVLFPSVTLHPDLNTQGVAWGDFNGDGHVDLLETAQPNLLHLRLGAGDGTFAVQPPMTLASLSSPPWAGDFNNDGQLDFAVVFTVFGARVHLGDGAGGFTPQFTVDLGGQPLSTIQYPDLDGDGVLDVVASTFEPARIAFALGDGDGNFGTPQFIDVGSTVSQLVVAQIDGQGWLDLVALREDASSVNVLVDNGSGTYGTPILLDVLGNQVEHLAAADLDGNGDQELILSGPDGAATLVATDPNNGLAARLPGSLGGQPRVGDFNGDDQLDLVLVRAEDHRILLGAGDGTFGPAGERTAPGGERVFLEDLNADGRLDLLVDAATVALGTGAGVFSEPRVHPSTLLPPLYGLVDLDGEGTPDLLARDSFFRLAWMRNGGDGDFAWFSEVDQLPLLDQVFDLDANGDGTQDIAYRFSSDEIFVRLGAPDGFSGVKSFPYPADVFQLPRFFALDADGDSFDDVLVVALGIFGGATTHLLRADPSGSGDLLPAVSTALSGFGTNTIASPALVDEDPFEDLLLQTGSTLTVLLSDGSGGWTQLPPHPLGYQDPIVTAGFDVTGDGLTDLILRDVASERTYVQPGLGGGSFGFTLNPAGFEVFAQHVADADGDGDLDLFDTEGNQARIALNDGTGSFGAPIISAGASALQRAELADVNLDGFPDFVAQTDAPLSTVDEVTVGLGNGDGTFNLQPPSFLPTEDLSHRPFLLADFTGDGAPDLLVGEERTVLLRNARLF